MQIAACCSVDSGHVFEDSIVLSVTVRSSFAAAAPADRARVAMDVSKLKLIKEHCSKEYPEYVDATETALSNIERERKENVGQYNPYAGVGIVATTPKAAKSPKSPKTAQTNGASNGATPEKQKRNSLFGGFLKNLGKKGRNNSYQSRSKSVSAASTGREDEETPRALSDVDGRRVKSERKER